MRNSRIFGSVGWRELRRAMSALVKSSGDDFGYVPMDEPDSPNNLEALVKWNAWNSGQ